MFPICTSIISVNYALKNFIENINCSENKVILVCLLNCYEAVILSFLSLEAENFRHYFIMILQSLEVWQIKHLNASHTVS